MLACGLLVAITGLVGVVRAEDDARVLWAVAAVGVGAVLGVGMVGLAWWWFGQALQPADDGGFGLRPAALVDWPVGAAAVRGGAPPVQMELSDSSVVSVAGSLEHGTEMKEFSHVADRC